MLSICIDFETLKAIKRDLRIQCPTEGSSFLTEAIARGLGYNTHASITATLKECRSMVCLANSDAFLAYCKVNGRNLPASAFLLCIAIAAIRRVRSKFDRIGRNGYGCGQPKRLDGRWETDEETYARFQEGRRELDTIFMANEFLRSLCLLNQIPQIKSINTKISSYGLKHIAEKLPCSHPDGEELGPAYVSNSALILAALHLGLKFRTYRDDRGYDSPNMNFNLSHKAIIDIDCIARPDGARAQDRRRKQERKSDPIAKLIAWRIRQQGRLGNPSFN